MENQSNPLFTKLTNQDVHRRVAEIGVGWNQEGDFPGTRVKQKFRCPCGKEFCCTFHDLMGKHHKKKCKDCIAEMKKQESLKQQAIRKAEKELRKAQEKALKACTPNQQTLCGKEDCTMCFDRSLASHARGEFWSDQNGQHAGCIRRGSNKKGWFDCDACQHAFLTTICT